MRVFIIGTGYVGLVSGACFADFGHRVTCIDHDAGKIARLRDGVMPIYEPGLEELVARNVAAGRLDFAERADETMAQADVVLLAVGTPSRRGDGHADLTYVFEATRGVAPHLRGHTVVVTKSTVPVGTGDEVERIVREHAMAGAEIDVASNPEFLREGSAIGDFKRPDRVVIGTNEARAETVMRELYRPLFLNETPIVATDRRTSELVKYASNAFLAVKIGFINQMADLCEALGGNVQHVARGMGLDGRIGSKFLNAGPGYGGSCFPKDTLALMKTAQDAGRPASVVEAVVSANDARKKGLAERVSAAAGGSLDGLSVAVLGLAFKPNTDDMREAPSVDLIEGLQARGASVRACDPVAMAEAATMLCDVRFVADPYDCVEGADLAVIVTEWDQYRALDLTRIAAGLSRRLLVDLRNVYTPDEARRAGLDYVSIGRAPVASRASAPVLVADAARQASA